MQTTFFDTELVIIWEIFLRKFFVYDIVCKMVRIPDSTINLNLYILLSLAATYYITVPVVTGYNVDFYSKGESPFGISYGDWVAKYWNWDLSIPLDLKTNNLLGLNENGCLVHRENSMVMLADSAAGGIWNQKCTISHNAGILIPIWTGECDHGYRGFETASLKQLSDCARSYDLGKVKGQVKVDNIPVATLDVLDYKTNIMNNVTEVYTKQFNITIPINSHFTSEQYGTFPAAAHGWFVFLKPLQPGTHTVYYQNSVEPTTLSGAGNVNSAQFTYHFKVE
ncbi:MAG TPA: hypothetical protein VNB67_08400 [Nitrososphaeraceae archaeon]|nr:hypothetical protein [Nitrososphaeraceae archaeon]